MKKGRSWALCQSRESRVHVYLPFRFVPQLLLSMPSNGTSSTSRVCNWEWGEQAGIIKIFFSCTASGISSSGLFFTQINYRNNFLLFILLTAFVTNHALRIQEVQLSLEKTTTTQNEKFLEWGKWHGRMPQTSRPLRLDCNIQHWRVSHTHYKKHWDLVNHSLRDVGRLALVHPKIRRT